MIHGFGFAGVLGELDLPAAQFAWALFQFNLGIELGQLFIVTIVVERPVPVPPERAAIRAG